MVDERQTQVSEFGSSSSISNVDEIVILENVLGNCKAYRSRLRLKMAQRCSSFASSSFRSQVGMPTVGLAPNMQQWLLTLHANNMELVREMRELRLEMKRKHHSTLLGIVLLGLKRKMMKMKKTMEKMLTLGIRILLQYLVRLVLFYLLLDIAIVCFIFFFFF